MITIIIGYRLCPLYSKSCF
uniref:Uncharacterized protein n=1 Tax=Rhizophora mucronata TaxID=61149 RepID=A0A2P2IPA4_RHIMU